MGREDWLSFMWGDHGLRTFVQVTFWLNHGGICKREMAVDHNLPGQRFLCARFTWYPGVHQQGLESFEFVCEVMHALIHSFVHLLASTSGSDVFSFSSKSRGVSGVPGTVVMGWHSMVQNSIVWRGDFGGWMDGWVRGGRQWEGQCGEQRMKTLKWDEVAMECAWWGEQHSVPLSRASDYSGTTLKHLAWQIQTRVFWNPSGKLC